MSYVVTISRDKPISSDEFRRAVEGDDRFSVVGAQEESQSHVVVNWLSEPGAKIESFVFNDGSVNITTPSDGALLVAQRLAYTLGARVIGEEGEDLTRTSATQEGAVGCAPLLWSLVTIGALLAVFWLAN